MSSNDLFSVTSPCSERDRWVITTQYTWPGAKRLDNNPHVTCWRYIRIKSWHRIINDLPPTLGYRGMLPLSRIRVFTCLCGYHNRSRWRNNIHQSFKHRSRTTAYPAQGLERGV